MLARLVGGPASPLALRECTGMFQKFIVAERRNVRGDRCTRLSVSELLSHALVLRTLFILARIVTGLLLLPFKVYRAPKSHWVDAGIVCVFP